MASRLASIHALTGILSIFAFLLVFVELLGPTEKTIRRVRAFALLGAILIFTSWVAGGYHYVTSYGADVKPAIKEGSAPWIHGVIMETKEHVFLFLPFLAILATAMISNLDPDSLNSQKAKTSVLLLSGLIILLGLVIAGMGYLISAGARAAGVG